MTPLGWWGSCHSRVTLFWLVFSWRIANTSEGAAQEKQWFLKDNTVQGGKEITLQLTVGKKNMFWLFHYGLLKETYQRTIWNALITTGTEFQFKDGAFHCDDDDDNNDDDERIHIFSVSYFIFFDTFNLILLYFKISWDWWLASLTKIYTNLPPNTQQRP